MEVMFFQGRISSDATISSLMLLFNSEIYKDLQWRWQSEDTNSKLSVKYDYKISLLSSPNII